MLFRSRMRARLRVFLGEREGGKRDMERKRESACTLPCNFASDGVVVRLLCSQIFAFGFLVGKYYPFT